jgi:hypothetical protein
LRQFPGCTTIPPWPCIPQDVARIINFSLGKISKTMSLLCPSIEFTGLTSKAFAAFWSLRDSAVLKGGGIEPLELAREIEKLLTRFQNSKVNSDEQRQLRAALYRPLLKLGSEDRTKIVELVIEIVTQ